MYTFERNNSVLTIERNLEQFIDRVTEDNVEKKTLLFQCAVHCPKHLSDIYFAGDELLSDITLPINPDLQFCTIQTQSLGAIPANITEKKRTMPSKKVSFGSISKNTVIRKKEVVPKQNVSLFYQNTFAMG